MASWSFKYSLLLLLLLVAFPGSTWGSAAVFDVEDDAPPGWMDAIFLVWIFFIHMYYAYKFTDYSLEHIHRQLTEMAKADDTLTVQERKVNELNKTILPQSSNLDLGNEESQSAVKHQSIHASHASIGHIKTKTVAVTDTQNYHGNGNGNGNGDENSTNSNNNQQQHNETNDDNNNNNGGNSNVVGKAMEMMAVKSVSVVQSVTNDAAAVTELGLEAEDDILDAVNETNNNDTNNNDTNNNNNNNNNNENEAGESGIQMQSPLSSVSQNSISMRDRIKMEAEDTARSIDIKVDYITLARPLTGLPNTRCCCIFPWSHILFSWSRTHAVRFFLRVAILLACSLAFVLWIELFGNSFLEFLITCYLKRDEGAWIGFFLLPFLVFVLETMLIYSWHALLIGWHMGSDKNGDMEALDGKRLRKAIKKLKQQTKRALRSASRKMDRMRRESMDVYKQESIARLASGDDSEYNNENENDNNGGGNGNEGLNKMVSNESGKSLIDDNDAEFEKLFAFDASEVEAKLQKAIRKHQSVIVGDFFVGTCWRLQVVTCTVTIAACTAWIRDLALFYQYLMRYMAMAGLTWCIVYFFFAIGISFYARISTWRSAHPEIPKWLFFFFTDATDYDAGLEKDPWVLLKMCVASLCIVVGVAFFIIGGVLAGNGYFYFSGVTLILYYLGTMLVTCKPYAVVALWRDDIPNPSIVFTEEIKRITHALELYELAQNTDDLALVYGQPSDYDEELSISHSSRHDSYIDDNHRQSNRSLPDTGNFRSVSNDAHGVGSGNGLRKRRVSGDDTGKSGNENDGGKKEATGATGATGGDVKGDVLIEMHDDDDDIVTSDEESENDEKEKEKEKEKESGDATATTTSAATDKTKSQMKLSEVANLEIVENDVNENENDNSGDNDDTKEASKTKEKSSKSSKSKNKGKGGKSKQGKGKSKKGVKTLKPSMVNYSSHSKSKSKGDKGQLLISTKQKSYATLTNYWKEKEKGNKEKDSDSDTDHDKKKGKSNKNGKSYGQGKKSTTMTAKEEYFFEGVLEGVLGDMNVSSSDSDDDYAKQYKRHLERMQKARQERADKKKERDQKRAAKEQQKEEKRKNKSNKKKGKGKGSGKGNGKSKKSKSKKKKKSGNSNNATTEEQLGQQQQNNTQEAPSPDSQTDKETEMKTSDMLGDSSGNDNETKDNDTMNNIDNIDNNDDMLEEVKSDTDKDMLSSGNEADNVGGSGDLNETGNRANEANEANDGEDHDHDDDHEDHDDDGGAVDAIDNRSSILPDGLITGVAAVTTLMNEDEIADHHMVNSLNGRVYSEFGRYTYRIISGFEFGLRLKTDAKYQEYWISKSKKVYYKGRFLMYNDKFFNVFSNYKNYWLDVYRPFDEYDVDRTLVNTGFMYGFQCCKQWLHYRPNMMRKERVKRSRYKKKNTWRRRCGKFSSRCLGWSLDHLCNILLAIFSFVLLVALYYFSTTIDVSESSSSDNYTSNYTTVDTVTLDGNDTYAPTVSPTVPTNVDTVQHYTMCDTVWQDSDHLAKLSVIDVLALTQIVYEQDDYDLLQEIEMYFNGNYEVVARRDVEPVFFHMRHKTAHVDYIAVRGTSTAEEALQDVSLFLEVTGFQLLSWVFPFLNALPTGFIRTVVWYASFAEGLINADARADFSDSVYDYAVEYLGTLNHSTSMYIVGHSLGGAIAQIVAAELYENGQVNDSYVGSFGLNSPGTVYSSSKFGYTIASLQLTSTSLLAERDIVSQVDAHTGNVQEVACGADQVYECHLTQTPFCEMFDNCANDVATQYGVINRYCNDDDYGHKIGAALGARNSSYSNITKEEPVQYLINIFD